MGDPSPYYDRRVLEEVAPFEEQRPGRPPLGLPTSARAARSKVSMPSTGGAILHVGLDGRAATVPHSGAPYVDG